MQTRLGGRSGFTLIETLVALVVFQIGMLALAGTAGVAARDFSEAMLRRRAMTVAKNRAEALRVTACDSPESGTAILPAMVEHWRVDVSGVSRAFFDSVVVLLPRGRREAVVARGWSVCAS